MSKTKLLLDFVSDLRSLADSLQAVCEVMTSEDVTPSEEKLSEPTPVPAESPKPTVTIEQIRLVLAKKSQARKTTDVRELLGKFGATKLSEIAPEAYNELLKAVEEL